MSVSAADEAPAEPKMAVCQSKHLRTRLISTEPKESEDVFA